MKEKRITLKRKGKKVIFDSHEHYRSQILHKDYLPSWCLRIIAILYGKYEDYVLQRIDGVIFPCPMDGVFPLNCKNTKITTFITDTRKGKVSMHTIIGNRAAICVFFHSPER